MSLRLYWVGALVGAVVLALLAAPFLLLVGIDAGWLDGVVRGGLEAKLHRKVSFGGLKADLLAREPRLVFSDLHIGQPAKFGPGEFAQARTLDLTLHLWPLLAGRFEAPTIRVDGLQLHLRRHGPGEDNWTFGRGGAASSFLARTRRLEIGAGRVDMDDPQRKLTLAAALANDPDDPNWPLHLAGSGLLKGADYRMAARAGPLNARTKAAPWPFRATMLDGATRVDMDGATKAPFNFDAFDMQMTAQGPNLADLYYLFGFTPLNSRPYKVAGRLRLNGKRLDADELHGRIGDSDIAGDISSDLLGARRRLIGKLHSQTLTAADLQIMLASPPPRLTARSRPGVSGQGDTPKGKLFSHTPFSLSRLEKEDMSVDYAATNLSGFGLPIADVDARLTISNGALALKPLTLALAGGRAMADFVLAPGRPNSLVVLKLDAHNVRLAGLTHGAGGVGGALDLSIDAKGRGASIADAAGDASGRAGFRLQRGAIPKAAAAVLGGDLFGMIAAKLGDKGARTSLRCVAGDFDISGGIMTARRLVAATDVSAATGGGMIDLGRETLALHLQPADVGPKPAIKLSAPIIISGPFAQPKVGAQLSKGKLDVSGVFGALARSFRPKAAPALPDSGC